MSSGLIISGMACAGFTDEGPWPLPELVFDSSHAAMKASGVTKSDIDLSIVASYDLDDGYAFSNGASTPAAAGYMSSSYRVTDDFGVALIGASSAIKAGDADVVLVVGVNPLQSADLKKQFLHDELVSNYSFDPVLFRSVWTTSSILMAMHASKAIANGLTTQERLAQIASDEINRGRRHGRSARTVQVTPQDVLSSQLVSSPLTQLMLPATIGGAVAMVLVSDRFNAKNQRARLVSYGASCGAHVLSNEWLTEPESAVREAANLAYSRAGITDVAGQIDIVELTAASPALVDPFTEALGASGVSREKICKFGGVRSCFPRAANGGVRLLDAVEALELIGKKGGQAVVHSMGNLTGPASATHSVHIVELI